MKAASPQFTGCHAAAIIVCFFAVVVTVNLTMARLASSTFGGVVVENSYVASQHYNKWLDEARQEATLGWNVRVSRRPDGRMLVLLSGTGASDVSISAIARHPLGRLPDRSLRFSRAAEGHYLSVEALAPGRWRLRIEATAGAQRWRQEIEVQ